MLKYLDAGTGSMLVQMAVAGVAGAAVFFKIFWAKVTRPFRRNRPDDVIETEHDHAHQGSQPQPADD
ncbi:MAG: hypothetical protein JJD92_05730 [Frankiaceae bacterium]|nr:hypothetical protein [Frankiaceae bacterium]